MAALGFVWLLSVVKMTQLTYRSICKPNFEHSDADRKLIVLPFATDHQASNFIYCTSAFEPIGMRTSD